MARPPASIGVPCPRCGRLVRVPVRVVLYTESAGRLTGVRAYARPFTHECTEDTP